MSKPGFSLGGLSLKKKPTSKFAPAKRKPVFGGDSDDDDAPAQGNSQNVEAVTDFGGIDLPPAPAEPEKRGKKKNAIPTEPPTLSNKTKKAPMAFGDLSGSLSSRKTAEEGEKVDKSIYEYDSVYESIKPKKKGAAEEEAAGGEKKSRYMGGLMAASAVRKRDQQIAEEKKIAKDREAEGEEFADKEKFVTAGYRRQQEENKLAAEEEKKREAEEGKKNTQGGM
ncbi:nuclear speckle splicing regulatory protein 1 family protein, partial [Candidatus Bathyarchaeota archaeon]|nr:nuclear speckle splicing regulatory protein 1 family protein [Candidatus Bathyarchaeota archaeon]